MELTQTQIKNRWKVVRLGEVAEVIDSLHITPKYSKIGYPMVRVTDIKSGFLKTDGCLLVDEKVYTQFSKKHKPEVGDLVFSRVGSLGITSYIGTNEKVCLGQNTAFIIPQNKERFLYFWLTSKFGKSEIDIKTTGASQKTISLESIKGFEIALPPFQTQNRIAEVLSAYDDLIENNEKRIKILEQMAQKLYTEWFVQFKFPGHEKVKMVDSGNPDFGMVPEGWEVKKVGDIAEFLNGYPFKPSQLGEVGLPIVKIPELRSGILDKTPRNTGEKIPSKYLLKNGDILFSWSATLLVNIWNSGEGILNQHLFKVTPKESFLYSFVYIMLQNQIEKYRGQAVGATMQHLRKDVVEGAFIILPSQKLLLNFEESVGSLLHEISNLTRQNQNLKKSRDLLIPQLVGGRLEIK